VARYRSTVNPSWVVRTGRLIMRPVSWNDLDDLRALKSDPEVFAIMLGGVRTPARVADELAEDIAFWGAHGAGMWSVREIGSEKFIGYVGLHERPDGRGIALRFALVPAAQGRGYASEAAAAALRFGHEPGRLRRIIALARENNFASRMVLGNIGMVECDSMLRDGYRVIVYESVSDPRHG
jgi:RimJ/RimL family protein N-acetyltransferase